GALPLKRAVRGAAAGHEACELGKGDGKRGEGHHRKQHVLRIEIGGDEPLALLTAELVEATLERAPPLALAEDATVAGVERLPLHEAHPVAVAAHDVEPERETAGRILGRGGDGHRPLAQLAGENLAEEILLVAEVMVEHP